MHVYAPLIMCGLTTAGRLLSRRPRLRQFDALLTPSQCEIVRSLAAASMGTCSLSEQSAGQHERSSTGCWLPRYDSPRSAWRSLRASDEEITLVGRVEALLAELCGMPPSHGEPAQVLRYRPGQEYAAHPDFFDPRDHAELANGGQRVATCLVYLTSVPSSCGGATSFPNASLRVQPVAGRAIIWRNVRPGGSVDPLSVHAGNLVRRERGRRAVHEKWVLSKWMRQRPFDVDLCASFGAAPPHG